MVTEGVTIMTNAMMMERSMMGMPGMTNPGMGTTMAGTAGAMTPNMVMVPRCTMKVEKVSGGMKVTCICDDATACSMMQNLCQMLAGSMCSMCCMMNGMVMCCCNMTMGMCKTEMMKNGCTIT